MKKNKFLLPLTAFALLVSFGLVACNNGGGQGGGQNQTSQKQEAIKITSADGNKLIVGRDLQLTSSIEGVTWASDNEQVATVSAAGLVHGVAVGKAKITASKAGYKDGTFNLNVDLEGITITAESETTLLAGQTVLLKASQEGVEWKSSDPTVATVVNGLVAAIRFGTVEITASKQGFNDGKITINVVRPEASAKFDLTVAADHYSADGWWELPSSGGGFGFAMQTVTGWNPISQQNSWGQQTEDPVETFIGGFGVGDKETVKFNASKAIKAEIVLDIGNTSEATLKDIMSAKVNDAAVDFEGVVLEAHEGQYGMASLEFSEISLGEFDLLANENVLEFNFLAATNIFLNEIHIYAGDATVTLVTPAAKEQIAVKEAKLEVIEGESVQIESEITDLSYVSVDETIATVDEYGSVTGVKVGKTNITVKKEGMYSVRVEVTVNPKPVAGQILLEAESAEELADVVPGEFSMSGPSIMQDGGGMGMGGNAVHSGAAYVMAIGLDSLTLTFKFTSESSQTMVLSVVGSAPMSMGGSAAAFVFADSMVVKMNEEAVTPVEGAEFPAPEGYTSTMSEVTFGDVAVKAGENVLVVEITGSVPSLDVFKLSVKA